VLTRSSFAVHPASTSWTSGYFSLTLISRHRPPSQSSSPLARHRQHLTAVSNSPRIQSQRPIVRAHHLATSSRSS
jgi:hypothetical protein